MSEPVELNPTWLELFTWVQPDGSLDFFNPRPRPEGQEVESRELTLSLQKGIHHV